MGFGLIFLGLITLLLYRLLPVELLGFIAVYKGLNKLSQYGKDFAIAKSSSVILLIFSVADAFLWLCKMTDGINIPSVVFTVSEYIHAALIVVFFILLSNALFSIANDCGYEKGMKRAMLGKVLSAIYIVSVIACGIFPVLSFLSMLLSLILYVFYPFTVYGFYMMIVTDSILKKERIAIEAFDKRFGKNKNKKKK